jgi:hypothetical protein
MDHSPFRKLPPEIRIEIFEYVLYSPSETGAFEWDDKGPTLAPWMTANKRQALTSVCRQIRAESFPIFYRFDKISFGCMVLNKFQPGFFVTDDENKQQMIRDYLGPSSTWVEKLSDWLEHMGDDIRKNIKTIDIHLGEWKKTWTSFENPLMVWLTEALARIVRYFDGYGTQVYLCTLLQTHDFVTDHVRLYLPVSNMAAAYDALNDAVQQKKEELKREYHRYPSLYRIHARAHDKCHDMMCVYLEHLDARIKQ